MRSPGAQRTPQPLPRALAEDCRYRVLGEIGRGGMGVVYEAVDRQTGEHVAIKLLASGREGLLRFKNEFRLASRLAHPNLISLYDLVIAEGAAWFVMELAPGVDLRRWVRGDRTRCDVARLVAALDQILDALDCLGRAGVVHRDLKPSNIKVAPDGQVRLLDFGLAGAADTPDFSAAMLAGTPTYMSPEQIEGRPLGPESDLYSLGTVVYEMLVGEPPFVGAARRVLTAQRQQYPVPPSDRVTGVPPELELWCLRLLAKRPEERFATAAAARDALPDAQLRATRSGNLAALPRELPLVGRERERGALSSLLERVREGESALAVLWGESGIGKTALAEALLDEAARAGCRILRGACREREAVTYNAFDAVVDAAAATVERMVPRDRLAELAPDLSHLQRLFPVLRELAGDPRHHSVPVETSEADRERAFAAARRLVERAIAWRPLVVLLDDLHWADEDSLALLGHLLHPGLPGLLLVGTAWPVEDCPLQRFLARQKQVMQLELGPLGPLESARVVESVVGKPLAILDEAQGNPFLLVELARLAVEEPRAQPTVSEVARRRLALLDEDETPLIELAAVAPGPIDADLLRATLGNDSRRVSLEASGLRRLCALKILREARTRPDGERYDFYHHRIREAIREMIEPARQKRLHLRLAETYRALRPNDPESLVRELLAGGDEPRAAAHAERAAEAAMGKLAHARAVELFELALCRARDEDRARLGVRLGEALEGMGRFAAAAAHYQAALDELSGLERTRVEAQLANCLMHTGDLDRSGAIVEGVLAALGHLRAPHRFARAIMIVWLFARLFVEGWRRGVRREDDPLTRVRLTAYSLAVPHYQFTSRNLEQLEFALRYRLLGTRSPSPEIRQEAEAMALALLLPVAHVSRRLNARVEAHFRRLEAGAQLVGRDRARAWLPLMRALYAMVSGRPDRAIAHFDKLDGMRIARTGYIALQRHNALILAGEHERYVREVTQTGATPQPLERVRLAYIERVRGRAGVLSRLRLDDAGALPWTHRSLFTYQLVELHLLDGRTRDAARLAKTLLDRIRPGAVSPTTGAFESADAVVRAYLAEARRLREGGLALERAAPLVSRRLLEGAEALLERAESALRMTPLLAPPLFAGRLLHDRALMALGRGRRREALRLFHRAEAKSRTLVVPCFRLRLLQDLEQILAPDDPRRCVWSAEADALARHYRFERLREPAAWLFV